MITNEARIIRDMHLDRIENALKNGDNGCSCSEAVLAAYGEAFGLDRDMAVRIASGFGGGMGLRGDTCGAVTAAFMALGLIFGTSELTDGYTRQKTYMLVDEYAERFIERQGSLECRNLCVGHSMSTPEGSRKLRASGIPQQIIQTAVEILEDIINEETDES